MAFSLARKSDEALMKLLSRGKDNAFEILFRRYFQRLVSFFLRSTHDEEVSKDLAQEVLLKIFRAKESYEEKAKFTTWLFTIARNTLLNHYRDVRKDDHLVNGRVDEESTFEYTLRRYPSTLPDPAEIAQARELGKLVEEAIFTLPESLKTPFVLAQVNGLAYQEISEIIGATPGAVKLRVFRAREMIHAYLHEKCGETMDSE